MDHVISGFQPLDLDQVKKSLPKTFKKITNDRDLESEIAEICGNLKDVCKSDQFSLLT